MKDLLDKLFDELKAANSPLVHLLQPGIDKELIGQQLKKHDLHFTEEWYDLYSWKNGIRHDDERSWNIGEIALFDAGIFISFDDGMDLYKNLKDDIWSKNLYPIFESGAGDYFLVNAGKGNTDKKIYFLSPGNPFFQGLISIGDSLTTIVQSILECYQAGIYYFNQGSDYLQINDKLERTIYAKNNPDSDYWKLTDY